MLFCPHFFCQAVAFVKKLVYNIPEKTVACAAGVSVRNGV